jgi:hypothetical protein
MKIKAIAGVALAAALAAGLTGCMSMDEMLASEDGFWRDIGETKAVDFVLDDANPMDKRLETVGKIANQSKLADIYVAKAAKPEVKAEARKRITEPSAFVYIYGKSSDRDVRRDALNEILKNADATLQLAWCEGLKKPEDGAKLAKRVKDNRKLSLFIVAKARELLKFAESCSKKQYVTEKQVHADNKYILACCGAIGAIGPLAADADVVLPFLEERAVRETKGTETDLVAPFNRVAGVAALAGLTDDDRRELLESEGIMHLKGHTFALDTALAQRRRQAESAMSGRRGRMARAGIASNDADESGYKNPAYEYLVTEKEVVASFSDKDLAAKILAERKRRVAEAAARERVDRIKSMDADGQKAEIAKIANMEERQNTVFAIIDSLKDFGKVTAAHREMLAAIPAKKLAERLRWAAKEMQGNEQQYRASGPAAAKAIKDQKVIKDLLLDNPKWAYEMGLEEDFGKAYATLLKNCTDEDTLEELFRNGKPDEHDRIVKIDTLCSLFKRLSPERQSKLLAEARARADEEAKKNVVVKGYWLGMSVRDYYLINADNGYRATVDWTKNEKITAFYFNKENRDKFLDVGKGLPGITKFAALYGKVPDGIDLSQNDRTETRSVMRSIKHINFDAKGEHDRYRWEYSHFAKYVDSVHNFQAEIKDETGELTIRYPVDEGVIGVVDKTKEEESALVNALF